MRIEITQVQRQLTRENRELQKAAAHCDILITKMQSFVNETGLQGEAYCSTKEYYSGIEIPLTKAMVCMYGEKINANNRYSHALSSYFGSMNVIDQDAIATQKRIVSRSRQQLERATLLQPLLSNYIKQLYELEKKLQNQIDLVSRFQAETRHYYDSFQERVALVRHGFQSVNAASYTPKTGYTLSATLNRSWADASNELWLQHYTIPRPKGMSNEDYRTYKKEISAQISTLHQKDGWDSAAIKCYLASMNKKVQKGKNSDEYFAIARNTFEETHQIGSSLYTEMLKASKLSDKEKVSLVIKQMGGVLDSNGMLQLTGYGFAADLPPHGEFWGVYAEAVQKAYGDTGFPNTEEGTKLHQFRMYIDRQNLTYVRNTYKKTGMTDADALRKYVKTELEEKLYHGSARLHNKYPDGTTYLDYMGGHENKKRLTRDFHSEFIIDKQGNFVSQWNILEAASDGTIISSYDYYKDKYTAISEKAWELAQREILDTESFNYASSNNGKDEGHNLLDIDPPKQHDTDLRKTIGKSWTSPGKGNPVNDRTQTDPTLYNTKSDKGDDYSEEYEENDYRKKISNILP